MGFDPVERGARVGSRPAGHTIHIRTISVAELLQEKYEMAKVAPFHSKLQSDLPVYHDNNACTEGNNIEARNRKSGTGGRPKCQHCKRLS